MNNQLHRQIQEEMEREAMIERKINNGLKRVLKNFKQYKLVNTIDEGEILLIFNKKSAEHFSVFLINDEVKEEVKNNTNSNYVMFFIRPKKKNHNSRLQALADIDKRRFKKNKFNLIKIHNPV